MLNHLCVKDDECRSGTILMPIHRRRFRIEQAVVGDMPIAAVADGDIGPMHHEIMSELRAIRAQMGSSGTGKSVAVETIGASVTREIAEALALLDTYRAQIEQCEKLKVELDLIHDAISRTKREIACCTARASTARKWPRSMASSAPWSVAPKKPPSKFWKPPRRSIMRRPRCPR